MRDPIDVAADPETLRASRDRRVTSLIQVAPGPEQPDVLDRAGRQGGMVIALAGAGAFWAAIGAAAALFLK